MPLTTTETDSTLKRTVRLGHADSINIIIGLIKKAFQSTMQAGDQKLIIDLEWPNDDYDIVFKLIT